MSTKERVMKRGGRRGEGGYERATVGRGFGLLSGVVGSGLGMRGNARGAWGGRQRQSGAPCFRPFSPPPSAGRLEEKKRQKAEPVPRRSCSDSKPALCAALIFPSRAALKSSKTCRE